MNAKAFDLGEEIDNRKVLYKLHPDLWKSTLVGLNTDFTQWTTLKYLNPAASDFNPNYNQIVPNNSGGIYLFWINCPLIQGILEFPAYIGRAHLTGNQNLRKRTKEYFQKFKRDIERPKIVRLFKYWEKHLHLSFIPIVGNANIDNIEEELINALLFPFNDRIPNKEIADAIKSFQL